MARRISSLRDCTVVNTSDCKCLSVSLLHSSETAGAGDGAIGLASFAAELALEVRDAGGVGGRGGGDAN